MSRRFLVLHGWQNRRPPDHWQSWLVERLRRAGERALYPQLPSPDHPRLDEWLAVLRSALRELGDGERVVICHSLACLLWLRHVESADPVDAVDRLLLVSPPGPAALPAHLAPFHGRGADAYAVARSVRGPAELVCSDADPWCPEGACDLYGAGLGLGVHVIPGGGHLSPSEGFGPWPAMEEWALTGSFDADAQSPEAGWARSRPEPYMQ